LGALDQAVLISATEDATAPVAGIVHRFTVDEMGVIAQVSARPELRTISVASVFVGPCFSPPDSWLHWDNRTGTRRYPPTAPLKRRPDDVGRLQTAGCKHVTGIGQGADGG
jgi:hypothetical protein